MTTPYPYRLSNRQRTQYLTRRGLLRIAIPLPLDWLDGGDLYGFALSSLAHDVIVPDHLRSTEELEIAVVPSDHPLGKIIGDTAALSEPHYVVPVVVATISVDEKPRHETAQLQWPGDVSLVWPPYQKKKGEDEICT